MAVDQEVRANKLWDVLTGVAKTKGATITYAKAASKVGVHHRVLRFPLDIIGKYCNAEGLPPLTGIVVRGSDGIPGSGFTGAMPDYAARLAGVYAEDWNKITNPFSDLEGKRLDEIATEILTEPGKADTFVRVLSRGNEQRVFRRVVLRAYDHKCAICGTGFHEVLQAAHIIPFGDERRALRVQPENGICLCANHHLMFDSDRLSFTPDYEVIFDDPEENDGGYNEADRALSSGVHGNKLRLPTRPEWRPSRDLLAERLKD
jgi:putative restriction endonuclease